MRLALSHSALRVGWSDRSLSLGSLALHSARRWSTRPSHPRTGTTTAGDLGSLLQYRDTTLAPLIQRKKEQLLEMERKKELCATQAAAYPRRYMLFQLGFLLFQIIVLFDWTFIHFDWSLTEPITYVLGYSATWFALLWYGNLQREFGYGSARDLLEAKRRGQLYADQGLKEEQYQSLKEELAALELQWRSLKGISV